MKQLLYKVEAFIVPARNSCGTNPTVINAQINSSDIDSVATSGEENVCKHKRNYRNNSSSMQGEKMQNMEICLRSQKTSAEVEDGINNINEGVDINCQLVTQTSNEDNNVYYSTNVFHRLHTLSPISERTEDKPADLCYHGCINGCSAIVPTPQEVSEEIFKESWLQKLEDIKRRESVLRTKETILHNREKVLLEKEKELVALEHFLRDKLGQVNLHVHERGYSYRSKVDNLKEHRDSSETLIHTKPKQTNGEKSDSNNESDMELNRLNMNKINLCTSSDEMQSISYEHNEQVQKCSKNVGILQRYLDEEKRSITKPSCSSLDTLLAKRKLKQPNNTKNYAGSKAHRSKSTLGSNNSKTKKASKIYYDDLDTTLSADVGDASFVQTSQKFNPMLYRKPYAFRRTISERYVRYTNNKSITNVDAQNVNYHNDGGIGIEEKVLKKVTQNIFASQDRRTKFQHYGLIDKNVDAANEICVAEGERKYSYLDLETSNKSYSCQKLSKNQTERPVSWNDQTNEWLQKKRKAYNMTTKKLQTDNKENLSCNTGSKDRLEKTSKKGDIKTKILTIFR